MTSVSIEGKEFVFNIVHLGDVFGEIALIDGGERSADAVAMTDLVLNRRDFMPILERCADICLILLRILCQSLRRTSPSRATCPRKFKPDIRPAGCLRV
jgi:CRP-like cAMP-binding protein